MTDKKEKKLVAKPAVKKPVVVKKPAAKKSPKVMIPCPDCTVLVANGGKSEFTGKGGPKAGLINEHTHCPNCEGHGVV